MSFPALEANGGQLICLGEGACPIFSEAQAYERLMGRWSPPRKRPESLTWVEQTLGRGARV